MSHWFKNYYGSSKSKSKSKKSYFRLFCLVDSRDKKMLHPKWNLRKVSSSRFSIKKFLKVIKSDDRLTRNESLDFFADRKWLQANWVVCINPFFLKVKLTTGFKNVLYDKVLRWTLFMRQNLWFGLGPSNPRLGSLEIIHCKFLVLFLTLEAKIMH